MDSNPTSATCIAQEAPSFQASVLLEQLSNEVQPMSAGLPPPISLSHRGAWD